jgi:hypothetical protein
MATFAGGMLNPLARSLPDSLLVPLGSVATLAATLDVLYQEAACLFWTCGNSPTVRQHRRIYHSEISTDVNGEQCEPTSASSTSSVAVRRK